MSRIDTTCTDPRPDRREELALLAGGDLPPEDAARLEAHAEGCPACGALLAGLRESAAALALLAGEELAGDPEALARVRARVREGVRAGVARIDTEREERESPGGPPRWALAAVLLVALVAAAVWMRSGPGPGPARDPVQDPPAEQVAERAPETAPPSEMEEDPGAPAPASPPADRVAQAAPSAPPAAPSARGPEAPAFSAEADPTDPSDATAGAPDAARPAGSGAEPGAEPQITIRVVSDDPDIVFYWLVEPEENRDEETVSS